MAPKFNHFAEAEALLVEGRAVVREIRNTDDNDRRDRLGKQAHGIWLQAQAHATLAQIQAESKHARRGY